MVKEGIFSVELVNAETNHPFQEHQSADGEEHYAEVEPNAEYWIRIQVDLPENQVYMCDFEVDGKNLGFSSYIQDSQAFDEGLWSRTDNQETLQAIKIKPLVCGKGDYQFWMGMVKVQFGEALEMGEWDSLPDFSTQWSGGTSVPVNGCSEKKALASAKGEMVVALPLAQNVRYEWGNILHSISIHYCTAAGLVEVGVLSRPSAWENPICNLVAPAIPMSVKSIHHNLPEDTTCLQTPLSAPLTCSSGNTEGNIGELIDLTNMEDDENQDEADLAQTLLELKRSSTGSPLGKS